MVNVTAYVSVKDSRCFNGIGARSKRFFVNIKEDGTIVSKELYDWLNRLNRISDYVSIQKAGLLSIKQYQVSSQVKERI